MDLNQDFLSDLNHILAKMDLNRVFVKMDLNHVLSNLNRVL